MRPVLRNSSFKPGISQSQYLDRMQRNKIEKLARLKDEEKNKVKAKKAQLESLKTELEMIKLISGAKQSDNLNEGENDHFDQNNDEDPNSKISSKLI